MSSGAFFIRLKRSNNLPLKELSPELENERKKHKKKQRKATRLKLRRKEIQKFLSLLSIDARTRLCTLPFSAGLGPLNCKGKSYLHESEVCSLLVRKSCHEAQLRHQRRGALGEARLLLLHPPAVLVPRGDDQQGLLAVSDGAAVPRLVVIQEGGRAFASLEGRKNG